MVRLSTIQNLPQTSVLLTSNSGLFCPLWEENRICIPLKEIAPSVVVALIATEDRRFRCHFGVDPIGILRAGLANLRAGRVVQGGSTLTQQLARMAVLHRTDRTLQRKVLEVGVALILEIHYAKEKILESYLNSAYFGHNVYGIELAALHYCGKRATDLSAYEAAYLVGLLRAPARYCRCCNPVRSATRTRLVLGLGKFQPLASSESSIAGTLKPRERHADLFSSTAGYPREYVRAWLKANVPNLYPCKRLLIRTTIDPRCQIALDRTCAELMAIGYSGRTALIIQDSHSGAIRAMSGGVDFQSQPFNSAANGSLQPGSLLKPFVLLAALQKGISIDSKFESRPLDLRFADGRRWVVRNAGNKYYGNITLSDAMVHSDNTVYAQLMLEIGFETVLELLNRCGFSMKSATPALCVGAVRPGLSPLQVCAAYSVFSTNGSFVPSSIVSSIADEHGQYLWKQEASAMQVCSRENASIVVDTLKRVSKEGTGKLTVPRPCLAAKTGTSISGAWHMSFDDTYRVLTWTESDFLSVRNVGYSGKGVTAKSLATRIWSLLGRTRLGLIELCSVFAGVDSMSVRELLWVESEFQKP
jgi:penicillin-binding protein 1A